MVDKNSFIVNSTNLTNQIGITNVYLTEFEKEVQRAKGATVHFFNKEEALSRVMILNEFAPDDPRVKELFQRARNCVLGASGKFINITSDMVLYLKNEENIRKLYAEKSKKAWDDLLRQYKDQIIENPFPTPDIKKIQLEDLTGKYLVLDEVMYPMNQFMGVTGEYVYVGKRSTGMYFIKIDDRSWLGPYEAVKRYRRLVDATMQEVKKWTILGQITTATMEVPEAGAKKVGGPVYALVVEPIALYVPGHVMGIYAEEGQNTGKFIGEEEVEAIKESWYTVKSVPDDVTPERLVEIFQQAIKEKNYKLYTDCIQPERRETPTQESLMLYFWDLHQERFHGEYVHALVSPDETKITVVKGYDDKGGMDAYFLSPDEQAKIAARYGEKVEYASVETIAFDQNGKQLGSPVRRNCIRKGNGRWYVREYELRF